MSNPSDKYKAAILGDPYDPNKTPSRQQAVEAFTELNDEVDEIAVDVLALQNRDFTEPNPKQEVKVASTSNITLSGEQTIDGVLTSTNRVLVKNQTDATENGIYDTGSGAWSRSLDMDVASEFDWATVYVLEGTQFGGHQFICTNSNITLGSSDINFVVIENAGSFQSQLNELQTKLNDVYSENSTIELIGHTDAILTTGTAATTGSVFIFADPVVNKGLFQKVRLFAETAGSMEISTWSKSGDTFTKQLVYSFSVVAGFQEIEVELSVEAGEHVGFFANGIVAFTSGEDSDNGGWYAGANSATMTDASVVSNIRLHISIENSVLNRIGEAFSEIALKADQSDFDKLEGNLYFDAEQTIGRISPVTDGSHNLSASMFVQNEQIADDGTLNEFECFTNAAGDIRIISFTKSGDTFTIVREITVSALGTGREVFATDMQVSKGEYLGIYGTNVRFQSGENEVHGWYAGSGQVDFTDASVTANLPIRMSFKISYRKFKELGSDNTRSTELAFDYGFINNTGQSLGEGSQTATSGTTPITTVQEYDNLGFAAYPSAPSALLEATVANTQRATNRGEFPGLGAMSAVRAALERDNDVLHTDVKSTLVVGNNAIGGRKIAELNQGTASYNSAIAQASALSQLVDGKSVVLASLWTQGESDGADNTTHEAYKNALIQLANNYDVDFRAATGQKKRVPLITYQTSSSSYRYIGLAQLDASLESSLIYMACPMYMLSYYDSVHIDSVSARILGAYYGEVLKKTVLDGEEWEPLRAVDAKVLGNSITLTFNKSGLKFDTTLMPAQTNQGFSVEDELDASVTISSISIQNGNQVKITCASTPSDGWKVKYGHNYATGKSPYVGGGGNLRDSAGLEKVFDTVPLHNWCALFDWSL